MGPNGDGARGVTLVRHEDDRARQKLGALIPRSLALPQGKALAHRPQRSLLAVAVACFCTIVGTSLWYAPALSSLRLSDLLPSGGSMAALLQFDPYSERAVPFVYGPSLVYAQEAPYETLRTELISAGASFIDLDAVSGRVRAFVGGVVEVDAPLSSLPQSDSWCALEAGVFKLEAKVAAHRSSYLDVTLPDSLIWQGNRFLHGTPVHGDGDEVDSTYARDCVRVKSEVAEQLFSVAVVGMPVVVHAPAPKVSVSSDYESKVADFPTPYYLVADVKNDTILAVGERHTAVPIASLTKLMTALIATEELALDKRVAIEEPNLIESVMPRLFDRSRVSVHALLELLLLESSNEAAEVLAGAVGREAFIAAMNARAAKLGLRDTVFVDPSGVDAGNVSSVNDLWWLTRYLALQHPFLVELTRGTSTSAGAPDGFSDVANFNTLDGVGSFVGGKVGETEAAGQTSITLHWVSIGGEERLIAIILLGSQQRTADVATLLTYLEERFGQ